MIDQVSRNGVHKTMMVSDFLGHRTNLEEDVSTLYLQIGLGLRQEAEKRKPIRVLWNVAGRPQE